MPVGVSLSLSFTIKAIIDPFRPRLIVSSNVFQVVFFHSVCKFCIIFDILLLFALFTCRSQVDLYLLSFFSAGSTFNYYKHFSSPFVATYPALVVQIYVKLFSELSEDHRLKVFENRVLRGRFGPKSDTFTRNLLTPPQCEAS